jgi:DNA-directed RNA polymerase subunit L
MELVGMKMKRITMVFEHPLNKIIHYQGQTVTQEDILRADVQGIKDKVKKELDRVLRSINLIRVLNPAMFQVMIFHIQGLEHKFEYLVEFKKVSETQYEFVYPQDSNAILTIKDIASKLGPLKKLVGDRLKDKDMHLVQILRERELIDAFTKFSFREMQLNPEEYSIQIDEFESGPASPAASPSPSPPTQ